MISASHSHYPGLSRRIRRRNMCVDNSARWSHLAQAKSDPVIGRAWRPEKGRTSTARTCARSHYVLRPSWTWIPILRGESGGILSSEIKFEHTHDWCLVGLSDSPCPFTGYQPYTKCKDENTPRNTVVGCINDAASDANDSSSSFF